jgi:hypothetical protein
MYMGNIFVTFFPLAKQENGVGYPKYQTVRPRDRPDVGSWLFSIVDPQGASCGRMMDLGSVGCGC